MMRCCRARYWCSIGLNAGVCVQWRTAWCPSDIYAVAALAGGLIVAAGHAIGVQSFYSMLLGAAVCVYIRLMAIYRDWSAPVANEGTEKTGN